MQTATMTLSFGPWKTPALWHELPLSTWQVTGAPRREQSTPVKTDYFGPERRLLGRPEFGLCPLEDACRWLYDEARQRQDRARRQDAERRAYERRALDVADLYARLQPKLGLYALDAVADLRGLTRHEVTALLELAGDVMERAV